MPRNLYHPQGDFAQNFAEKFRSMCAAYAEDYANYENGYKPTPMRWKMSSTPSKRSSKKTAIIRQIHKLESQVFLIPVENPNSKKTLVLKIQRDDSVMFEAYYVKLPIGEIYIDSFYHHGKIWRALYSGWEAERSAHADSPLGALAKLLGQHWGDDKLTGQKISIYSLFKAIVFLMPGKRLGNVRNYTYKFPETIEGIRFVRQYVKPMPTIPAWTPPARTGEKLWDSGKTVFEPKLSYERPQYMQYFSMSRI